MRKLYLSCILVFFISLISFSQNGVAKAAHEYFRSDPFGSDFSAFLKHLLNDPTLADKELKKRTDTSLFYFRGNYTKHNPFFFKAKRVEIMLNEAEVKIKDSVALDTIYLYQLAAYTDNTETGTREIKKEFEKIFRRYKGSFYKNTLTENSSAEELQWATYNFFAPFYGIAPFAVSWIGPNDDKEICLLLTIRINSQNNKAVLPIPFNAP
ncbi:MAG: hypothetical protein JNK14_17345 [Chitinophagaceae bacterium]|nr:hypothetical protein [Chitinophagaceae bacterium]